MQVTEYSDRNTAYGPLSDFGKNRVAQLSKQRAAQAQRTITGKQKNWQGHQGGRTVQRVYDFFQD